MCLCLFLHYIFSEGYKETIAGPPFLCFLNFLLKLTFIQVVLPLYFISLAIDLEIIPKESVYRVDHHFFKK